MYAIVDIETTGGHASAHGITEVAIRLHDGQKVFQQYETLINPGVAIPVYIQALTGISNEMVSRAPLFSEVAAEIFQLLSNRIFVAHNVNFDYSFLRHHLLAAGYDLHCKKLCTVRMGRKIMPGLPSYSLGKFCNSAGISISNRHRAAGDADATAILFGMLLQHDKEGHIQAMLNQRSKEQSLPPNLPKEQIDALPFSPGVYYFHNKKGKPIYVGKAKSLNKRVRSHFANNSTSQQKQEFLREIYSITYQKCGTELIAFILEAIEIKRLWPYYNRSQKRFEHSYGLFMFEDQNGYLRLAIDKRRKFSAPLHTFNQIGEGHFILRNLITEFNLCSTLCFVQSNHNPFFVAHEHCCEGACTGAEPAGVYNQKVQAAVEYLKKELLPTFAVVDKGRDEAEQSCILMEQGRFYGMGYLTGPVVQNGIGELKSRLTPYPANDYIRNLVQNYVMQYPERKMIFA